MVKQSIEQDCYDSKHLCCTERSQRDEQVISWGKDRRLGLWESIYGLLASRCNPKVQEHSAAGEALATTMFLSVSPNVTLVSLVYELEADGS